MSAARPRRNVCTCRALGTATSVGAMNVGPLANQLTAVLSDRSVYCYQMTLEWQ